MPDPTPPPASPPTAPPPRPRFKLHPICFILALLALARSVFIAISDTDPDSGGLSYSYAAGTFAGALFVAFVPALLAFYASRRSSRVGNLVFGSILTLVLLGSALSFLGAAGRAARNAQGKDTLNEFSAKVEDLREEMRQQAESEGHADFSEEQTQKFIDAADQAAKATTGPNAAILNAGARVAERLQTAGRPFGAALERFSSLGGLDPTALDSPEKIDQLLATLDDLSAGNAQLTEAVRAAPNHFRSLLAAANLTKSQQSAATTGYLRTAKIPTLMELRKVQDDFIAASRGYLTVLKERWGTWSYDEESGSVLFEDDADIERFQKFADAVQECVAKETELQNTILARDPAPVIEKPKK